MSGTAVIYARVSSEEQGKGYSIDTQLAQCREYCECRDFEVVAECTDLFTGTTHDRPGLAQLYEVIVTLKPVTIVTLDVDRLLGRGRLGQVLIKEELESLEMRVEYVLGGGSDGSDDGFLEDMKMLWSRHENRQRIERSRDGKFGRTRAGHVMVCGDRSPYGYDYISEAHRGKLVINEKESAVVRDMYHWLIVDGLSSYAIAERLHTRDIPTRGDVNPAVFKRTGRSTWRAVVVRQILGSPVYKGEWYFGKTWLVERSKTARKSNGEPYKMKKKQVPVDPSDWIKVDVPPLIDATTWQCAQDRLKRNQALSKGNTKREYLLRGLIFCTCGQRWAGRYHTSRNRGFYRCPARDGESWRQSCNARFTFRQDVLEPVVWDTVVDQLLHPEAMLAGVEQQREEHAAEVAQHEGKLRAINAKIANVDRRLEQLLDQVLDGIIPQETVAAKTRLLTEERRILEQQRWRLEASTRKSDVTRDVEDMLRELSEIIKISVPLMTFEEKRRLLEILRIRIDVIDKSTARVTGVVSEAIVVSSPA